MRILVLTQMYPPHHVGGYASLCRDVAELWRAHGHAVDVLTTTYRRADVRDECSSRAIHVRRDLRFYWDDQRLLRPAIPRRVRFERANQRALERALRETHPDVVSVWHMGAMSLGLLQTIVEREIPVVLVVGDDWLVYGQAVDAWTSLFVGHPRLARFVGKLTGIPASFAPPTDALTACFASEWLRRRALDRSPWPLGRNAIVPHGIDADVFRSPSAADRRWTWRLLYVGRVEERKGVHIAVDSLSHLPSQATLDVVGPADAGYVARLRQHARRLGVGARARFAGAVERSDLRERYAAADVLVFPVIWEEPFGLVPLEAMAAEVPVIATGTGGSAEYLRDNRNCLLVPRNDAGALADAIRRLAADPELRRSLVHSGRTTASDLSVTRLADTLRDWHFAAVSRFHDGVPADRRGDESPSASAPGPDV